LWQVSARQLWAAIGSVFGAGVTAYAIYISTDVNNNFSAEVNADEGIGNFLGTTWDGKPGYERRTFWLEIKNLGPSAAHGISAFASVETEYCAVDAAGGDRRGYDVTFLGVDGWRTFWSYGQPTAASVRAAATPRKIKFCLIRDGILPREKFYSLGEAETWWASRDDKSNKVGMKWNSIPIYYSAMREQGRTFVPQAICEAWLFEKPRCPIAEGQPLPMHGGPLEQSTVEFSSMESPEAFAIVLANKKKWEALHP
jgi:hypothetical protein